MSRRRARYLLIPAMLLLVSMTAWEVYEFIEGSGFSYYGRAPLRLLYVLGLTVCVAIPVILVDRFRRRTEKRTPPQCKTCGYNLSGNLSGVCPECGQPIADGSSSDSD